MSETNQGGDREALQNAIRENLSPEGVVMILAFLQTASVYRPANELATDAMRELNWFADTLRGTLGGEEHNRLMEELEL